MSVAVAETRATQAKTELGSKLVTVKDNGMFNSYDHVMVCHGCGAFHAVRSSFISTPMSIGFKFEDGSQLSVPASHCGKCPSEGIRDAWENGMKRLNFNAAAEAIGAQHAPEPEQCRLCLAFDHPRHLIADGSHSLCAARARIGNPTPPMPSKYA